MSTTYLAYTRVSTTKQSTESTSLEEQRRAIAQYAQRHHLSIKHWFEEVQSAAKGRRTVFKELVKYLRTHKQSGVIIHKIDRSARNLRDWADLGELIDKGIDVRFAHDDLDLSTRGGRLTADIQEVIAADYIRNLREEVRKGIKGRINQGLYPFGAPRGYLDNGTGRAKTPDPIIAPLIVESFKQYSTGTYTLKALAKKMSVLGLVQSNNKPLTPYALSSILRNRFYLGEFVVKQHMHQGQHQPLITIELFKQVQSRLRKRSKRIFVKHNFKYRRRLTCNSCHRSLIGEKQKGRVYYRCHYCPRVTVREDRIEITCNEQYTLTTPIRAELEPYTKFDSPKGSKFCAENQSQIIQSTV